MHDGGFSGVAGESLRPPTKSNAGPFLVAALTMAIGIGGGLWWKLARDRPAASAAAPIFSASARPLVEQAPPPPPPPPLPVASSGEATRKSPTTARVAGTAIPGCSARCTGSVTADLQSALRARAGAARSCYERALRQNETLQGRITVAVRVGAQGRACGASLVENSLGDPAVANCVVGILRSASLPAPNGGCVDVQVPMSFVGRQ
jgi:hypothetical protein